MNDFNALFESARTIAVVGCSKKPSRTSHRIARYLQEEGFRIVPVNPNYEKVLGEICYPDTPSIPDDVEIDVVDIFRDPAHTAEMVEDVVRRIETTGERPVIWTQIGVSSPEAEEIAREADLPYVKNRCIMVEHGKRTTEPT